ncbi:FAD/NAD(P)-binding protein [Ulvibacterium marinum]|nr:FAD/NAD(P)-binding protein [Ulvibacterium marinum]
MKEDTRIFDVAIVGCGPRGLSALESLFRQAAKNEVLPKVLVVEKSPYPGAGPVYDLDQADSNWLNVSRRAVGINNREKTVFENFSIPDFPDFQEWSGYNAEPHSLTEVDEFPLRSELGKYLHERYNSIAGILHSQGLLVYINGEADIIRIDEQSVVISILGGQSCLAREAALCIGHQPIELDGQMTMWLKRVQELDNCELYTQPYPVSRITNTSTGLSNYTIAIRGFGLAMIDVVRALTIDLDGKFEITDDKKRTMKYHASGKEPRSIIPFSLDGLPMAPKPLNKEIDLLYIPSKDQLEDYGNAIFRRIEKAEARSTDFLIDAIAPIIADKFIAMDSMSIEHTLSRAEIEEIVSQWLRNDTFSHELLIPIDMGALEAINRFIAMATGSGAVSLDYCIGHVWRHCQPTMYRILSFAPLPDDLICKIVALDERLKRYSYGPPVDSLQQLSELADCGILDLSLVNNPEIELAEVGWTFELEGKTDNADIMINSVLDSPQLLKVQSPIIKGILMNEAVAPIHDKLGARTEENGLMISKNSENVVPVAMMGRLAKGTLIGVDAIAECFGTRSVHWAKGVIDRKIQRDSTQV